MRWTIASVSVEMEMRPVGGVRGRANMTEQLDYAASRRTALIIQYAGHRRASLEALAQSCELDVLPSVDPQTLLSPDNSTLIHSADYILTDLHSETDQFHAALDAIAQYLNGYGTELLVWASAEQVDTVYAAFASHSLHILCDAQDFEAIPILTGALKKMKMQGLKQDDSPTDYRSLHRISDELADFARTLARIAEQDDPAPAMLSDRPVSFRPAPAAVFEALIPAIIPPQAQTGPSAVAVRNMLKLRRKRENYFDKNLFADPAWDILLDLYASQLEGRKVSVSSLCIAASVPPTTGLRWISAMTEDGLLVREHDPDDARRVFIQLSSTTRDSLRAYFVDSGISIPVAI
jgi:DNA-binding MarR family transcriptional regulator